METEILKVSQVAAIFGVHPATVKSWAEKGLIVGFKTPGGHWRFRRADIDAAVHLGATPAGAA